MIERYRFYRTGGYVAATCAMVVFLGSCQLAKNQLEYDRAAEADRQHYRDVMAPIPQPAEQQADIPDFQAVLSTPEDLSLPTPLVTVSVNQTVSLRELLFELADQAGVDLELDPQIRGSIIFTAKERPFDEVVARISEMAGLRYNYENNVLRVEHDRPFVKNYDLSYLTVSRSGTSSINTSISLSGTSDTGSSTGGGSSSSVSNTIAPDVWKDLEENLEQILTSSDTYMSLATTSDPVSTPVNPTPPPPPPSDSNAPPAPPPLPGSPEVAPMPAAAAPQINITAPPAEPMVPSPPATFSITRQTGMISVFASARQQRLVEKFLNDFRRRATTQILIEAKVLQVDLTDDYSTGVDWRSLNLTGLTSFELTGMTSPGTFTGTLNAGNDLQMAISAISTFGTVRALSSPRVTVLNNQLAVVNVAENQVYFEISATSSSTGSPPVTTTTFDVTQKSAPEGVLMNVVPTANPDTGEIMLTVRPTVTKITEYKEDPSIELNAPGATVQNLVPQLSVQELDSVVKMQSGQTLVMGGLMQDQNIITDTGVPILGDIPLVGNLFKQHSDAVKKTELVIFLRAEIVPGSNVDEMDRKLYKGFALDRRPVRM